MVLNGDYWLIKTMEIPLDNVYFNGDIGVNTLWL
jgi:hypothetical protein